MKTGNLRKSRYMQIKEYFENRIRKGEYKNGDKIPTEEEICKYFNVSRITAGKALNELVNDGYIVRRAGKGSFVNLTNVDLQLNSLQGYTEEMTAKGLKPSSELLIFKLVDVNEDIATKLHIEEGTKVYFIKRLRYANDVPMAIEEVYIPFYIVPNLDQYDIGKGSFYKLLHDHYNIEIFRGEQSIEATTVDAKEAVLLNMKPEGTILRIERITYLQNNTPCEYVLSLYRGDRYKFNVELMRKKN